MGRVAVDFGSSSCVLARLDDASGRAASLAIDGVSSERTYRGSAPEATTTTETVHVIPSLIHYSPTEVWIGDQVVQRGLVEHRETFRWMKRSIAYGVTKRKKTA